MSDNKALKTVSQMRSYDNSLMLCERAEKIIPLASQTFSKAPMSFVRGASPLFIEKGKGAIVWDVDGNDYIDFMLGLMPIILGYQDKDVDNAIIEQLNKGIIFSLACDLEIKLSEMLVDLIPSAEIVRFAKNGSDVTSGAIRVARAYTGKDRVAACGYHGWHDWYIGATARDIGVPKVVKELTKKFEYNNAQSLEDLLSMHKDEFACVIMEPMNAFPPEPGFLSSVREICDRHNVILIFDEIVSGWRPHLGGAQSLYNVIPDISCFGKGMANGMPMSALVAKKEFEKTFEDIFFSGTFGGEALSMAASIATINKLKECDLPSHMRQTTAILKDGMETIIADHKLDHLLHIGGADWWPRVMWKDHGGLDPLMAQSLLVQELSESGLLIIAGGLNLSLSHCNDDMHQMVLNRWNDAIDRFSNIMSASDPVAHLRGEAIQPVFKVRG